MSQITAPVRAASKSAKRPQLPKPIVENCWRCDAPGVKSDGVSQPILCEACHNMARDLAVNDARGTIQSLRKGEKPFDGLEDHQRLALLNEILGDDGQDLRQLGSPELVELAGNAADEIARRLGSFDPSPAERARIEAEAQNDYCDDQAHVGMH